MSNFKVSGAGDSNGYWKRLLSILHTVGAAAMSQLRNSKRMTGIYGATMISCAILQMYFFLEICTLN